MQTERDPYNENPINGIGSVPSPLQGDPSLRNALSRLTGMEMDIDVPPSSGNPSPYTFPFNSLPHTPSGESLASTPVSETTSLNKSSRRADEEEIGNTESKHPWYRGIPRFQTNGTQGDPKRFKANERAKPNEEGKEAWSTEDGKMPQETQISYQELGLPAPTGVPHPHATPSLKETQATQKKTPMRRTGTGAKHPNHDPAEANAIIQRTPSGKSLQTPRASQKHPTGTQTTMPKRGPQLLGSSARPKQPIGTTENLGGPKPRYERVPTPHTPTRRGNINHWEINQQGSLTYEEEQEDFPRHLGYDLDDDDEEDEIEIPTPPRTYVVGEVHGMDDRTKFTNMHKDMKIGWDSIVGPKVLVYSHGATFTGQYQQEMHLLSEAVGEVLDIAPPELYPPSAEKDKRNPGAAPWPFLLADINEEQERTLCEKRWFCNGEIACHFIPYHPKPSTFWLSIDRITAKNNENGSETVLDIVINTLNSTSFRTWLRGQIDKANDNLPEGLLLDDAVDYMLSSIEVKGLPIEDKDGNDDRVVWNVYGVVHTNVLKFYYDFIRKLNETTFKSIRYGRGFPLARPFQCIMCKSIDHPTGHCPFPGLPGWIEPEAFIGTQSSSKGRGTGNRVNNARGAPRGAERGLSRGGAQGRGGKRNGR